MKKKIFALILAILCLTAVPALADGWLELGDIEIYESGSGTIGDGTYDYDAATKTLTLTDVHLTGESHLLLEYHGEGLLDTIVLNGENTISATDRFAISVYGDTTFTGEGSLTVNAPFAPITVNSGDLIIDGVDIAAQDSNDTSSAVYAQGIWIDDYFDGKIELRNGGSLRAESYGIYGAINCGSGGVQVTGGSRLVIDSHNSKFYTPYYYSLTVSDTSSAEILSVNGGLPACTEEAAEAAVLVPKKGGREDDVVVAGTYDLSFNKGSEPYIFTVTQTARDDGRNRVTITGVQKPNAGGEGEAIPMPDPGEDEAVPMPETGDESQPILWMAMLLTAAAYFIKRRKANA